MIFLLFLVLTFACNQYLYVNFPAISGDKGVLTSGNIEFIKGQGLYVNIFHSIGEDTQRSFLYAYRLAKIPCRVDVQLNSDVVGGSGGLLAYIILKYQLNNTIASGAIDSQGNVYPIGGLKEKIEAAMPYYDHFITSISSPYQYYIVKYLFPNYNITLVNNINELYEYNGKIYGGWNISRVFYYPPVPETPTSYNISFLKEDYNMLKNEIFNHRLPISEIEDYYKNLTLITDRIAQKGYYYSAANTLFLAAAEKVALYYLIYNKSPDVLKQKVTKCLSSFDIIGNSEDDVAAKVRRQWAYDVLNKTYGDLYDEKYAQFYEYEQAYLWCNLAKNIHKNQEIHYNLEKLESLQKVWLKKGYSSEERYRQAIFAIDDILVSLYNLAFVVKEDSSFKSYSSKWAAVYASQAEYLKNTNQPYQTTLYVANNLETVFGSPKQDFLNILVGIIISLVAGYVYLLFKSSQKIL